MFQGISRVVFSEGYRVQFPTPITNNFRFQVQSVIYRKLLNAFNTSVSFVRALSRRCTTEP